MKYGFVITVLVAFVIPLAFALAQIPAAELIELVAVPNYPGANQEVTVTAKSYLTDLDLASISWIVNGKTIESGKGLKSFSFTTGALGSKNEVEMVAISSEGYPLSSKISFYPTEVSLIYEASSYTPPFYRGRAYFPYGGSARVYAITNFADENGQAIPSSELVFKWKEGEKILESQSGYGRNYLEYRSSNLLPRPTDISVEVSSSDQKYYAGNILTISPVQSKVVLYEDSPEYGLLTNKALTNTFTLKLAELDIAGIPFFFSATERDSSSLSYVWKLNGQNVNQKDSVIVLKKPGSGSGQSRISLELSNNVIYYQYGTAGLIINFAQ